jgi:thiol-disulfide isomerase/thioredoxin
VKRYLYLGLTFLLLGCAEQSGDSPTASLEELRGQWVVINYWAQWCKPCIEEIPELNTLDQKYEQVTVLGVNYDGAIGEALAQQQTRLGLAFASLEADPSAQLGIPRPIVLPTTLILDPDGQLAASLVGPQTIESLERAMNLTTNGTPP